MSAADEGAGVAGFDGNGEDMLGIGAFVSEPWQGLSESEVAAKDALVSRINDEYGPDLAITGPIADEIMVRAEDTAIGWAYREMLSSPMGDDVYRRATSELLGDALMSDFFYAPASTRFHLCAEGGLSLHSLSVSDYCVSMVGNDRDAQEELGEHWKPIAVICAMFHDACKIGYYEPGTNLRNGAAYRVSEDRHGDHEHGERSVRMLRRYYGDALPQCAYDAVEWHMGEFDHRIAPPRWEHVTSEEQADAIATRDRLMRESPFVRILHEADMASTQAGL